LNSIDLITDLKSEIPYIYFDENQIKQALLAIFLNAIEAMDRDGKLSVVTGVDEKNEFAYIIISDTGRGIPKEIEDNIFEPFFTTKDEIKGVGLGLSTAYGIIKKHNGEINVKSELNVGSIFTIKLPVKNKPVEHE
jgi:signal transduction histidine kinase